MPTLEQDERRLKEVEAELDLFRDRCAEYETSYDKQTKTYWPPNSCGYFTREQLAAYENELAKERKVIKERLNKGST
jgi:hypothetical protein